MARLISYDGAPVPVRADIIAAHVAAWERLGRPGTWWNGSDRVAIAGETRAARACALCSKRKEAVSPYAADGKHDRVSDLPEPVVDAVHRIATDPARLSERWYHTLVDAYLTDTEFVELVGVVVTVVGIDTFARGLGLPAPDLPEPQDGDPAGVRPPNVEVSGHWVPAVPPGDAAGANIRRALTLVPAEAEGYERMAAAMYVGLDDIMEFERDRGITRPQMELLAARVSALNECFY